jgi:protein SCO1/2
VKTALLSLLNLLLLLAIVWTGLFWEPESDRAPLPGTHAARMVADVSLAPPPSGGNFTLAGRAGPVALNDFSGQVVLLYFGYTYCPDICPTSLTVWQQALEMLTPAELARVQPLFVSVDPERDSLERLTEYVQFFHPRIAALTGQPDQLAEIARRYGAVFVRQESASAGGYVIDHSALTYVIDPQGRLAETLPHGAAAEQLLAALRKHLSSN